MPAQAVGIDDQTHLGPEEVDSMAIEMDLGLGRRQTRAERDRNKKALELSFGEDELVAVEEGAENPHPGQAREGVKAGAQRARGQQLAADSPLDGALEVPHREDRGKVDNGERGFRDRDAVAASDLGGGKNRATMDAELGLAGVARIRDGNVDWMGRGVEEPPGFAGALMAEGRSFAGPERGGHPPALLTDGGSSDRINTRHQ